MVNINLISWKYEGSVDNFLIPWISKHTIFMLGVDAWRFKSCNGFQTSGVDPTHGHSENNNGGSMYTGSNTT